MASSYTDVSTLRANIDKTSTADDSVLQAIIDAASAAIDRMCNRPSGFVADSKASARLYPGSGKYWQWIDECVEVTQVRVKPSATSSYETWASTDYIECTGDPDEPDYNTTPYTALRVDENGDYSAFYRDTTYPTVEVTAKWGFALTVPVDIRMATIMQSARWYKRLQSAMSDTLASAELGLLLYQQEVDPDIRSLLVRGRYIQPVLAHK